MKDYAEILMKAKPFVEADEFLDKDYFFKLYMAIRQHVTDIDFQTAIKCVLSQLRGTGKSLNLADALRQPQDELFPTQNKDETFDIMFNKIKDELPKSNLNNLIWMEAIGQRPSGFEELKEIVQRLQKEMFNIKRG